MTNDHDAVPNRGDRYCGVCRTAIYKSLVKVTYGYTYGFEMQYFHETDRTVIEGSLAERDRGCTIQGHTTHAQTIQAPITHDHSPREEGN